MRIYSYAVLSYRIPPPRSGNIGLFFLSGAAVNRAPLGNSDEFFACTRDRNELQFAKYKIYRFATVITAPHFIPLPTVENFLYFTVGYYVRVVMVVCAYTHIEQLSTYSFRKATSFHPESTYGSPNIRS